MHTRGVCVCVEKRKEKPVLFYVSRGFMGVNEIEVRERERERRDGSFCLLLRERER